MKYVNNPLFWGSFLSGFLSVAAVCAVNGQQALLLAFFLFFAWLCAKLAKASYIEHHDLFPARPWGALTFVPGTSVWFVWGLYGVQIFLDLFYCAFYGLWTPFWFVTVIAVLFGFLGWRRRK